ncbi:hypothetical protein [Flavobacterium sp. PL02]|uniref:hypothetical protein n=1 Tax=Flavobacterium sp. PL02 TaxID=3088354 RepID=UPI002B225537|nr:hypothetical protein [Flavobacterium sp. PL02]MEA9415424.1 hypothetical protein [Flavobacterium sp. PL02]
MNQEIIEAIENKNLVEFNYDDELRIVEPHCYGLSTKNNEILRAYQVDGYSSSGKMGWKLYDLAKAEDINILEDSFERSRNGYNQGDKSMSTIYSEL